MDSSIINAGSSDPKTLILNQVKQEAAMANARVLISVQGPFFSCLQSLIVHLLIVCASAGPLHANDRFNQKLNDHCFEKCVPTPGPSLGKKEEQCYTLCMEKYLAAWNAVSRAYVNRIPRDGGPASGGGDFLI